MSEYPGNVSESQIKQWTHKYGEPNMIEVDGEDRKLYGYFRKPNLDVLAASAKFAESDPIKSGTIMFEACWLGGDVEIKDNEEAKVGAINVLATLFKVREARLKKISLKSK